MNRTLSLLAALALLATLAPDQVAAQSNMGAGVRYELFIDCPQTGIASIQVPGSVVSTNGPSCPVRAIDPQDQMGDPSLAVDPLETDHLIMGSLHGGSNCGGPSVKSRCNQVFTTFTSTDHGARWSDQPFYPPSQVGSNAYGQHPQVTIDPYGRVYVGSLYAQPSAQDGQFDYVIAAQKFSSLQNINSEQDGEYNAEYLDPVYMGNAIGQMWFLFNPQTDNMTMVWHEQVTPLSSDERGRDNNDCRPRSSTARPSSSSSSSTASSSSTSSSPSSSSSSSSSSASSTSSSSSSTPGPLSGLVRVPLQAGPAKLSALDPGTVLSPAAQQSTQANEGPRSVIGVVWTGSSLRSCYQYQPHEWVIGPCLNSTNPVLSEGWLYVGCKATLKEGPFPYNADTVEGQVEMFRMHPDGGEPQYIGSSPIYGGAPRLGVRSDGRLALATANATEDGRLQLDLAFGKYNPGIGRIEWSTSRGYGGDIMPVNPALNVTEAQVQDLIFREHSGVVHFILKTRVRPVETVGVLADPFFPNLRKQIVAIDETYGVLALLPFDVGNINNRTDTTLLEANEDAYNDLSDDYLQLPEQDLYQYVNAAGKEYNFEHYQREFVAIGDYGVIMFAEVFEDTDLRGPAWGGGNRPPPPQPSPATANAVTNATVPAAGLTMVGALALALLSSKRKEAALVKAGRGKKDPNRL